MEDDDNKKQQQQKPLKKGDNPKGQGPCKPKHPKTQEEKLAQRAKQAEKKRLKKEQARLEEERKKLEMEGKTTTATTVEDAKTEDQKEEVKNDASKTENNENKDKKADKKRKKKNKNEDNKVGDESNKNETEANENNKVEGENADNKTDKNQHETNIIENNKENKATKEQNNKKEKEVKDGDNSELNVNKESEEKTQKKNENKSKKNKDNNLDNNNNNNNNNKKEKKAKDNEKSNENKEKEINKNSNVKDGKEKISKRHLYYFTTYNDRMKELASNKQNENINIQTNNFKNYLNSLNISKSNEVLNRNDNDLSQQSQINNEELILSLRQISLSGSHKQTKNCKNLLCSFKNYVNNVKGEKISNEIGIFTEKLIKIIRDISVNSAVIENTCSYLSRLESFLRFLPVKVTSNSVKSYINNKIDDFINKKLNCKEIICDTIGNNIIKNGDKIVVYGKSKIFRKMFLQACDQGINFQVIFVDSPRSNQISSEIEFLAKLGVSVTYCYLNGVSSLIGKATKVFIKAKSMLSNGNLQGKVGTALLACIAHNFKKPVIAFCQTIKFWDKIMLDSLHISNINNNLKLSKGNNTKNNQMTIEYDITPATYIDMVICEVGNISATSVPVLIREFNQKELEMDSLVIEK